jgi:hypothetical protein
MDCIGGTAGALFNKNPGLLSEKVFPDKKSSLSP